MDLGNLRNEYARAGLRREQLADDPFRQFEIWFGQANSAGLYQPNAMTVATVSADGQPSARTVLLKSFDTGGFVFYTNYGSRKARELDANPRVALLFVWLDLERQIKIRGSARRVSTAESLKYFLTLPRGSRLGAWCSEQSSVVGSRGLLEEEFERMKRKFHDKEVPLPSFWGGYRVVPQEIEFWQGRVNRLHDRFQYTRVDDGWCIERLAP